MLEMAAFHSNVKQVNWTVTDTVYLTQTNGVNLAHIHISFFVLVKTELTELKKRREKYETLEKLEKYWKFISTQTSISFGFDTWK